MDFCHRVVNRLFLINSPFLKTLQIVVCPSCHVGLTNLAVGVECIQCLKNNVHKRGVSHATYIRAEWMISNQDHAVLFASCLVKVMCHEQFCFAKYSGSDENCVVLIPFKVYRKIFQCGLKLTEGYKNDTFS